MYCVTFLSNLVCQFQTAPSENRALLFHVDELFRADSIGESGLDFLLNQSGYNVFDTLHKICKLDGICNFT